MLLQYDYDTGLQPSQATGASRSLTNFWGESALADLSWVHSTRLEWLIIAGYYLAETGGSNNLGTNTYTARTLLKKECLPHRTAREHQARGHFGLPESNVRASRLRVSAAERLRQERLAREARRRQPSAGAFCAPLSNKDKSPEKAAHLGTFDLWNPDGHRVTLTYTKSPF